MAELAGSLYLASTAAFALVALAIGLRLMFLSRRTRQLPEGLLGAGLVLSAFLGYGLLIFTMIARQTSESPAAIYTVLSGLGWLFHNCGVMCMLGFTIRVFRAKETWARVLALSMTLVLWGGTVGYAFTGGFEGVQPNFSYWLMQTVIGTYPMWSAAEAFRYYAMMRRRLDLGMAEPIVVNRFLLWGVASVSALGSIWVVNIPSLLGVAGTAGSPLMAICMLITSVLGTITVGTYWLTFVPPAWYRRMLETSEEAAC